ncbi:MAG TPA: hypothetical protein VLL51_08235, partial [Gemmatimonadales bacterium]|nr:hypothetical protein [Gemmatimonadales bacterium]
MNDEELEILEVGREEDGPAAEQRQSLHRPPHAGQGRLERDQRQAEQHHVAQDADQGHLDPQEPGLGAQLDGLAPSRPADDLAHHP